MSTVQEPTGEGYMPANQPPAAPYAPPPVPPAAPYGGQPQYAPPQAVPAPYTGPYTGPYGGQPPYAPQPPVGYAPVAAPAPYGPPLGPVGQVRSTWAVIGLSIITLGIYSLYYYFATFDEMKRHSGEGVGGALGLVLAIFGFGLVTPFLFPNEVGNLYARQGRPRPVTATTGLWVLLGSFILVGPLVWLIKTNGALNAYWRSMGAA